MIIYQAILALIILWSAYWYWNKYWNNASDVREVKEIKDAKDDVDEKVSIANEAKKDLDTKIDNIVDEVEQIKQQNTNKSKES